MPVNRIATRGRNMRGAYGWFGKPFRLANYIMPNYLNYLNWARVNCALFAILTN